MGEADHIQEIPFLEFPGDDLDLEQESEEWKGLRSKVREACETYGCFGLVCDAIPAKLRQEMFMVMKTLFDLPEETKKKHSSTKPYHSYQGKCPIVPLLESFGIDDAPQPQAAQAFTNLLWPEGNPAFCGALISMATKMLELNFIVLKLILESLGMEKYYNSQKENSASVFRLMKYTVPPSNDSAIGLVTHTDKNILTILCQNEVQGLEVLSKEGNWIRLNFCKDSFIVIIGDLLKAWTNGRLHAVRHRVVMNGDKDRYSCGMFVLPGDTVTIEVPEELVDNDHPLRYRPFTYSDYMSFFTSNICDDALEVYAGVRS
ncbi:hypothetical protein VitviT2T_004753 [Vitis vinifera]|uniref:Fe2OG dioxygenase domain-containing protein n=3 Tax=Vitis vinifera TaxID=29760 RepID=A0ABY9BSH7_VITVI|nr:hypothetical protein VitviT2T_004753 [Vitis vinifera]|eukprot:XP_002284931.1 PREDICTED: probable 2-oxoglutarate-dependent dioxygenase AOP1 [Vitis vinifera]